MSGDKVEVLECCLLFGSKHRDFAWGRQGSLLGGELPVEVADVRGVSQGGHKRGLQSPGKEGSPVNLLGTEKQTKKKTP